jgi:hypothetical protein
VWRSHPQGAGGIGRRVHRDAVVAVAPVFGRPDVDPQRLDLPVAALGARHHRQLGAQRRPGLGEPYREQVLALHPEHARFAPGGRARGVGADLLQRPDGVVRPAVLADVQQPLCLLGRI